MKREDLTGKRFGKLTVVEMLYNYNGTFEPVSIFGGEVAFDRNVRYDTLKNEYCLKNRIPLYRIPYTKNEKEIREIITNIINP